MALPDQICVFLLRLARLGVLLLLKLFTLFIFHKFTSSLQVNKKIGPILRVRSCRSGLRVCTTFWPWTAICLHKCTHNMLSIQCNTIEEAHRNRFLQLGQIHLAEHKNWMQFCLYRQMPVWKGSSPANFSNQAHVWPVGGITFHNTAAKKRWRLLWKAVQYVFCTRLQRAAFVDYYGDLLLSYHKHNPPSSEPALLTSALLQ